MNLGKNPTNNIEFTAEAIADIVKLSDGIPRNIVKLAREALRTAILNDREFVKKEYVIQ
jgi:type II secretory pathway predicted ATPase ExeA